MKAGMNNSFDELIKYIESSKTMKRYEVGRKRVKYLESKKPKPIVKPVSTLKPAGPAIPKPPTIKTELLKAP